MIDACVIIAPAPTEALAPDQTSSSTKEHVKTGRSHVVRLTPPGAAAVRNSHSCVAIDKVLQIFLTARARLRIELVALDPRGDFG